MAQLQYPSADYRLPVRAVISRITAMNADHVPRYGFLQPHSGIKSVSNYVDEPAFRHQLNLHVRIAPQKLQHIGLFEATSPEKIQQQFDVNVFGVMAVTRAVLPHFRKNKGGVIVNVSCGAGLFTLPMISLYCASKFALEGFSGADEVAQVIYGAATDGTPQLRYPVGHDLRRVMKALRELPDQEYVEFMRSRFS